VSRVRAQSGATTRPRRQRWGAVALPVVTAGLLVFWAAVFVSVILPAMEMSKQGPSENWDAWTADEAEGHKLYVKNGCSYCHSLYIRVQDQDPWVKRPAEAGDYYQQNPAILGTIRTGPDLSQAGGAHPDDWHIAHFLNPRYTRPVSLMPNWEFLGPDEIRKLTAYVQSLSGAEADGRVARQDRWRSEATAAWRKGADANVAWMHSRIPRGWRETPNPYPATDVSLQRGKRVYQTYCIGCHGPVGDGRHHLFLAEQRKKANPGRHTEYGDLIVPPPQNFTTLKRHLVKGKYIGGILFYQIMNGITGTAMPYFKHELESERIWDVSNYVAETFIGYNDAAHEPTATQPVGGGP